MILIGEHAVILPHTRLHRKPLMRKNALTILAFCKFLFLLVFYFQQLIENLSKEICSFSFQNTTTNSFKNVNVIEYLSFCPKRNFLFFKNTIKPFACLCSFNNCVLTLHSVFLIPVLPQLKIKGNIVVKKIVVLFINLLMFYI